MRHCEDSYRDDEYHCKSQMISKCCKAPPLGGVDENIYGHMVGVCSECKQEVDFEKDTEDESSR
jgi:hypothetical protein